MYPDGLCRLDDTTWSRCLEFEDVNYQLAKPDDQTAIFEALCDMYNAHDASIGMELSLVCRKVNKADFRKRIEIAAQEDKFDTVRALYTDMLRGQLEHGNNGMVKTKFLVLTIVNKVLEMLITLVVVTLISFLLVRLSPIDPAEAYARRSFAAFSFTDEQMEALREDMGLNDPLPVQYVTWVRDALHLDFGKSFVSGQPVFEKVTTAIGITVTIVLISAVIQAVFILLFGCLCYLTRKRMIGHALIFLCIAGVSIPSFFFASTYLDIFAVKLGLTSVAGNTGLMRYLPAAVCIGIGCIALFSPMLANNIQKEMEQDSAFYARCRGLSEGKILLRYALPNAVVTLLPSFCQMLGLCMAGSAIVERVFSLPGLGYLIIDSVLYRDSPVIHATILFLAFSLVMFNILSDILRRILQRDASAREGARL